MSSPTKTFCEIWRVDFQRGQALVFTLVFTAAAGLVGLLLFNSGMLANTKTQLQNAADAGAYSASVLQARDHNFSAYTNRAMVANQVAVAQMVSLKSYLEDAADTHDRMGGIWLSFWSTVATAKPTWNLMLKYPIESIYSGFNSSAKIAVPILDKMIKLFETAQDAHHVATAAAMVIVADEVIKRNDPLAKLSTGLFSAGNIAVQVGKWKGYTHQHSANDTSAVADRFADVVVSDKSTDSFTRNRVSVPPPLAAWFSWVNPSFCPGGVPLGTIFGFIHSGGTQLSNDKKRWLGLDASIGGGAYTCEYIVVAIPVTVVIPILDTIGNTGFILGGSGGAVAGAEGAYPDLTGYKNNPGSTWSYGGGAIVPAGAYRYKFGDPGTTLDKSGGLQDYYRDMTDPIKSIPKDQTPKENGEAFPITIEVDRPATSIRTASKFLPGSSIIKLDDKLAGKTMRALSSAHAYFYRPKSDDVKSFTRSGWKRDGDSKAELANLFSPYWQARLVDISDIELVGSRADQVK